MNRAGDAPSSADSLLMALSICDQLWFLKAAVESHGPALTRAALLNNVDQLGGSFSSALTLAQSLSATEHDGAAEVRRYKYSTSCTCWAYSGPPIDAG